MIEQGTRDEDDRDAGEDGEADADRTCMQLELVELVPQVLAVEPEVYHGLLVVVRLAHRVDTIRYVVSANSVGVEETEEMNRAFFENFTRFVGGCAE